jgi:hypothetical protein
MKKKLVLTILLSMFLTFGFGVLVAFGADDPSIVTLSMGVTDTSAMTDVFKKFSVEGKEIAPLKVELKPGADTTKDILFSYTAEGKLTFNQYAFDNATEKTKKAAMKKFILGLQGSLVAEQTQQSIIDTLNGTSSNVSRMLIPLVMDSTSADIYTAMKWVKPILPIIRIAFGVGAIVVTLLLIASTIADLCFIGLPIARENLQSKGDQSKGGKIPFISADAMSVVKETEAALDSSGGYKNAYLMYFKRRVLTYIILSICLLYLVVGELGGLISWLLSLGSGVV